MVKSVPSQIQTSDSAVYDVTVVISTFGEGGAQRMASILLHAWARAGWRLRVITLDDSPHEPHPVPEGVDRANLNWRIDWGQNEHVSLWTQIRRRWGTIRALRRLLTEQPSRAVVSILIRSNVATAVALWGSSQHFVISELNDPIRQPQPRLLGLLRRLLYRRADVVSANSQSAVDAMRAYVPAERLRFLPNALEDPPLEPLDPREPACLIVARLVEQKGIADAIRAFALLAEDFPEWRLDVLGDGPLRADLAVLAADLGLAHRILFHGFQDPFPYYARDAIFLLPSYYEGMPNALLEAMQMGMPAVVTDSAVGSVEALADGQSGLVVPVGAVEQLSEAMRRLMTDAELREKLGDAGRANLAPFALETVVAQWNETLGRPQK